MRNTILGFLLAVILIIGTATTTVSVMTVKPALPKNIVVLTGDAKQLKSGVLNYAKLGYIIKTSSLAYTNNGYREGIIVMEKY